MLFRTKFLKSTSLTVGAALILTACNSGDDAGSNTVAIEPVADPVVDVQPPTTPLEEEVGYNQAEGLIVDNTPRHDFENFRMTKPGTSVERNVMAAEDGDWTVDKLSMDYGANFYVYRSDLNITTGTVVKGTITLWTDAGETVPVALQIQNFCSATNAEKATESFDVTDTPQTFSVTHSFAYPQECARFGVTAAKQGTATLYANDASLKSSY